MKKIVIVFAFALIASFTYAAVSTTETNKVAVEKFDDKPKKKAEEKKECTKDKKECTKDEKACCSKEKKSSCGSK